MKERKKKRGIKKIKTLEKFVEEALAPQKQSIDIEWHAKGMAAINPFPHLPASASMETGRD